MRPRQWSPPSSGPTSATCSPDPTDYVDARTPSPPAASRSRTDPSEIGRIEHKLRTAVRVQEPAAYAVVQLQTALVAGRRSQGRRRRCPTADPKAEVDLGDPRARPRALRLPSIGFTVRVRHAVRHLRQRAAPPGQGGHARPGRQSPERPEPMGQYLPVVALLVLAVVFAAVSFAGLEAARPAQPDACQVGALRVRHRAEPGAARALPGALLPGRDDLHRLRHRDHLPVPVRGRSTAILGAFGSGRDGRVRGRGVRRRSST